MKQNILILILAAIVGLMGGLQGRTGSYFSVLITIGVAVGYYKNRQVDMKTAGLLIPTLLLFGILGYKFNHFLSEKTTEYSLAVTMGLCAFYFFYNAYKMK